MCVGLCVVCSVCVWGGSVCGVCVVVGGGGLCVVCSVCVGVCVWCV